MPKALFPRNELAWSLHNAVDFNERQTRLVETWDGPNIKKTTSADIGETPKRR